MTTLNPEQTKMIQDLLASVEALKASVGMKSESVKTSAKKVKDPNAPKRKPHAVIEEQKKVYAEMKAVYRAEHKISDDISDDDVRKMVKDGKLSERYPTYPDALKEHSRRRSENDPEHAKKAKNYRERVDQMQIKKRAERESKKSGKKSEASSDISSVVSAEDAPAPAPAPVPAPVQDTPQEKPKPKVVVKNPKKPVKTAPPPHEITTLIETDDPAEWSKMLTYEGKKYAMNGKNHLALMSENENEDADWVGIWDPINCKINYCDPPEDSDDNDE